MLETYHKKETIALNSGWKKLVDSKGVVMPGQPFSYWYRDERYVGGGSFDPLPDYFNSWDAIQDALEELVTGYGNWSIFQRHLTKLVGCTGAFGDDNIKWFLEVNARPELRAEALYLTFVELNEQAEIKELVLVS